MNSRPTHHPPAPRIPPLPVRLSDMREAADRYLAATPDERMAQHLTLSFYQLLSDEERFALERRFPNELTGLPDAPDAADGVRVAWDLRARELIVCMLQYGDRVLAARMDLVRAVDPIEPVALLAMTATGSFLELGQPRSDGSRAFVYRASARPGARREDGSVALSEPVKLGNPVRLGAIRTSELLIVACGAQPAADDDTMPGCMLFGPVEDEPQPQPDDPMKVGATRFRVLVDAAHNAPDGPRQALQQEAAELAADLQIHAAPGGGHALSELAWFVTGSGARYDVMQHGAMDLVRHGADHEPVQWLHDADIGFQQVVEGAPLVIFHSGVRNIKKVAFVFRVATVGPLG